MLAVGFRVAYGRQERLRHSRGKHVDAIKHMLRRWIYGLCCLPSSAHATKTHIFSVVMASISSRSCTTVATAGGTARRCFTEATPHDTPHLHPVPSGGPDHEEDDLHVRHENEDGEGDTGSKSINRIRHI